MEILTRFVASVLFIPALIGAIINRPYQFVVCVSATHSTAKLPHLPHPIQRPKRL